MLRSHLMNPHISILRPDLIPFILGVEVVAAPHSRAFSHLGLSWGLLVPRIIVRFPDSIMRCETVL
jgi:hypothetical protein